MFAPVTSRIRRRSEAGGSGTLRCVRLVIARCQIDYAGRLTAHLPMATRLIMVKNDGSVLVHSDGGSYKPLNWMSPPARLREGVTDDGQVEWLVHGKDGPDGDTLRILIEEILSDTSHDLGVDPGLQKDGVEKHLQELLADAPRDAGRRAHARPPGVPHRHRPGRPHVPGRRRRVRRGRGEAARRHRRCRAADPLPRAAQPRPEAARPVRGIFAAQEIKPQARVLATDRGIACAVVDYDALRGMDDPTARLF